MTVHSINKEKLSETEKDKFGIEIKIDIEISTKYEPFVENIAR